MGRSNKMPSLKQWQVNYCHASNDKSWLGWLLWMRLTPGLSSIFLIASGITFLILGLNSSEPKKMAQFEAMIVFFSTGLVNLLAYLALAYQQRSLGA